MQINDPAVLAEVSDAFDAYELALTSNQVDTLDALFWNSEYTLRYGAAENLQGYTQIQAYRAQRPSRGLMRTIVTRSITTFGAEFAVANITFTREGEPRVGRQSQSWVRFPAGWQVVAAHVSWMDV